MDMDIEKEEEEEASKEEEKPRSVGRREASQRRKKRSTKIGRQTGRPVGHITWQKVLILRAEQ